MSVRPSPLKSPCRRVSHSASDQPAHADVVNGQLIGHSNEPATAVEADQVFGAFADHGDPDFRDPASAIGVGRFVTEAVGAFFVGSEVRKGSARRVVKVAVRIDPQTRSGGKRDGSPGRSVDAVDGSHPQRPIAIADVVRRAGTR